jgi:hypothetical protein
MANDQAGDQRVCNHSPDCRDIFDTCIHCAWMNSFAIAAARDARAFMRNDFGLPIEQREYPAVAELRVALAARDATIARLEAGNREARGLADRNLQHFARAERDVAHLHIANARLRQDLANARAALQEAADALDKAYRSVRSASTDVFEDRLADARDKARAAAKEGANG